MVYIADRIEVVLPAYLQLSHQLFLCLKTKTTDEHMQLCLHHCLQEVSVKDLVVTISVSVPLFGQVQIADTVLLPFVASELAGSPLRPIEIETAL